MCRVQYFTLSTLLFLLFSTGQPTQAQNWQTPVEQSGDSAILSRFVPGKLMSYSPFHGNDQSIIEAARLEYLRHDSLRHVEEQCLSQAIGSQASEAKARVRMYEATSWFIKSNILYDVVLMPSLEVEYRFNDRWSAAIEGNMAWWHNNGMHKYYQLATILPEVRYWFFPQDDRRGHYVGLFGGGGWYDLENGGTGYKGEGGMVGVSYGYMFPVGKHFAFEVGIGLGFMTTEYEEYKPIDGHYVYQQTNRINYFGPLKLKFAFVWNIGRWTEKGGKR